MKWEKTHLFHTELGTHLRNTNFTRRVFQPALERAGVRKIRIHDLRHTAASIAISEGATPNMVQELLGHSSSRTTELYTHVSTRNLQQIRSPFDDL